MKAPAQVALSLDARRANLPVVVSIVIGLSVVIGLLLTNSTEEMLAYLLLTVACAAPIALWIWGGASTIPILSAMGVMFYIYYALPILRGTALGLSRLGMIESSFGPEEILSAAGTVSLFLFVVTLAWGLVRNQVARRRRKAAAEVVAGSQMNKLIAVGLAAGITYYIAASTGALQWAGPAFGFIRGIMLTAALVACFLVGHARAREVLHGRRWMLALAGVIMLVCLSWISLFLIGGILHCLAVMAGYVITSKRAPWAVICALAVVVTVLHAGKDEMRRKHWLTHTQYSGVLSVTEMPGMMVEWVEYGLSALTSGEKYDAAVDRASLLNLLLQAQRLAPNHVSFLEGRTYALIPQILVPRFINENRIASQAAISVLNVHFGIQLAHQTALTSIGWGLVAEAYANFGHLGVIAVAVVLGLFIGAVEGWSDGTPLASFPSLFALAVLMQLVNVEMDAGTLTATLFQTVVAVGILLWVFGILSKQRRARSANARAVGRAPDSY
jgi:hypothetical protein